VKEVHRLEVITGTGRRRQFTEDFKAQVVEETLTPGAVVSNIARRRGLTPQQVFTWRRQARQLPAGMESKAQFVPAIVEVAMPPASARTPERKRTRQSGTIEVEIQGMTVRIGRGADAKTIAAVLRAVKAGT
jgi:transposase